MLNPVSLLLAMGFVLISPGSSADLRLANLYSDLAKLRALHRSPHLQSPQNPLPSSASVPPLPTGCGGQWNTNPILTAAPRLLTSVPNGKLFQLDAVSPPILVAHAWGSHYEMGLALGQMLARPASILLNETINYVANEVAELMEKYLHVPREVAEPIGREAVLEGLQVTYDLTKDYTPQHFFDEIRGFAAGSHLSEHEITLVNMVPELTKAACTMIGAWGPASREHSLYQLRALDWVTTGPFQDLPLVTIYHPDPTRVPGSAPFMTYGYPGFIGTVTGYSSRPVGISEKFWNWSDYKGIVASSGYPWHYLLRDILEFDRDTTDALNRIFFAKRTCPIYIGIGDRSSGQFRAIEYSYDYVKLFSDISFPEYAGHPRMPGVVYIDKEPQPSHNPCLASLIKNSYGTVDAAAIVNISAALGSGDTHVAIYDYSRDLVYISSASSASRPPVVPASFRSFVQLDMRALWDEQRT